MAEHYLWLIASATSLAALLIVSRATLAAWQGWLDLRKLELEQQRERDASGEPPSTAMRIDVADLKERLRKLEAIAAGVDP